MGSSSEAAFLQEIVKRESGIVLAPDKGYLLETRLLPVAFKHGLDGLSGMALKLKSSNDPELLREMVEAMAASETAFFRDYAPFQKVQENILPNMIMARAEQKKLRIWSAACATGQEPYSIAMLLLESGLVLTDWTIEIIATDISQEALSFARAGIYTQLDVQRGLPARYLVKYFTQDGPKWQVGETVRDMVRFAPVNLVAGFGDMEPCDIVLCRYALSNFEPPTQLKVLQLLKPALASDGVLLLGLGESPQGLFRDIDPAHGIFGNI
jgi:chemotaxis protein methyltransferase CheR